MRSGQIRCACSVLALLSAQMIASVANAQANTEDSSQDEVRKLTSVTVTAQRREESLQSVPITVTAFAGAELEAKGIADITSLSESTPGVTIDVFPKAAPRVFIRGIGGANEAAGADPSSVAFVDGVYLGRNAMLSVDTFDLARVEVLKGPQGTLFGKNVVGGAIQYISNRPQDTFEGKARLTVGEYGQKDAFLVLNAPVSDKVFTRLSVGSRKNDGFRTNLNTGGPLDDEERINGRFQTLFQMSEDTDVLFSIDGVSDNSSGPARFRLSPPDFEDVKHPDSGNPDMPGFIRRDTWGTRLEVNSSSLGWADLTAYVSYRDLDFDSAEDFDGSDAAENTAAGFPATAVHVFKAETAESFTAEARLASAGDGPLSWIAGVFALSDTVDRDRESETEVIDNSLNRYLATSETESYAAFFDTTYQLSDLWSVFGGLRYTDETKEYSIQHLIGPRNAPVVDYTTYGSPGVFDEQKWTWRLGTDYQLTPNIFLFASAASGFKSGAFQEQPPAATASLATEPEEVINYETGIKTDFWSGRGRANVSVFSTDYSDLQTIAVVPDASQGPGLTRVITNTSDATINGLETEFQLLPTDSLELSLLYTYLDGTFDRRISTTEILVDGTPVIEDQAGNRLSRAPEHEVLLGASYTMDVGNFGELKFSSDLNYRSKVYDDNGNGESETREPRTIVNADVTFSPSDTTDIQLWVRNLTDEVYRTHQGDLGFNFVQYGAPRQMGLSVNVRF